VETGLQPFLFGWIKIMIYTGPTRNNGNKKQIVITGVKSKILHPTY